MKDEKFFGSSVIGERGQIVIPARAREEFKIKPGEEFIFFGHGEILHIIKADKLNSFLDEMTTKFTNLKASINKKV